MGTTGQGHNPGIWKQQNKSHKSGRHRSKGQIDEQLKGRQSVKVISKKKKAVLQKKSRRNRTQQIRSQKREEVLNRKRSIGVSQSPPHLVSLIPLHHSVDIDKLYERIKCSGQNDGQCASMSPLASAGFTVNIPKLKHRFQIVKPASCLIGDVLNCCQVSDTIVFLVSCHDECIDDTGIQLLSTLLAQGVSSVLFCVVGLTSLPMKERNPTKKGMIKVIGQYLVDPKLLVTDSDQELFNLLRTVAELKRRNIGMRNGRPYMLIEKIEYEGNDDSVSGLVKISAHVRGAHLDVNRLLHLVGWGDFQIQQVDEVAEHCPFNVRKADKRNENSMDDKVFIKGVAHDAFEKRGRTILPDPSQQQDLIQEAESDPLDAEQTWPTEEEIREAEAEVSAKRKLTKKVPKGTSDYQAAWILDEDEDWKELSDEDDMEESEEEEEMVDVGLEPCEEDASQVDEDDMQSVSMSTVGFEETASQYDEAMAEGDNDKDQLARFREERSNEMFPDEIDTPVDVAARIRFQKFRGLKSFRSSPWDPKENLPSDYARIFQFQSFDNMKRRIRKTLPNEEFCIEPGTYVTIHLKNVPKAFCDKFSPSSQLTAFGLFPHEQKMSVLHFAIKQFGEHSIKSKDELIFHVGFRQFKAKPVFSQHSLGSKFKMERFLGASGVVVASVYAPITFPPANVLAFKSIGSGDMQPVATGTLYKIDPDRVVVKRIILSGHPFRINKRAATIRYMFFNRDDVTWFKPVELRTKWGRRGHIKEPLGTHGHMKCVFDSQLTSQDTVMMMLYKRVFPVWSYNPVTPAIVAEELSSEQMYDEEFFN